MEATFLTAIHINKVRHLKDIDIPLSSDTRKNLILTGKNGSGKTSVLKELGYTLNFISGMTTYRKDDPPAVEVQRSTQNLHHKFLSGEFILARFWDTRNTKVDVPNSIEKVDFRSFYGIDESPVKELMCYMVHLKAIQAFSRNESNHQRTEEIGKWFQRFENILRIIYDDTSLKLVFDYENLRFTLELTDREPFDFNTMSMGYAAVFSIISDLIMRMESQHRYDLEGVVLIDKIETHLHVELQKKIVPILTELFPNIQFIMTTHSPFVLNSAPNTVIYDLEKHILVEDGLTNLPYEGIVEGYFGADRMSQELRGKFERYKDLVAKEELTDEEYAETAELETYLDEVPDYLALEFSAEYSRLKLEFANRG